MTESAEPEPTTPRTIRCTGASKDELTERLVSAGVELNDYARTLFASDRFAVSADEYLITIVVTSPAELGLPAGGTLPEILEKAAEAGLDPCPLEAAAYLRLHYLDQPEDEGDATRPRHRAPAGSLTVISPLLAADDDFPRGFYLRRVAGVLWLRGYTCSAQHEWEPDDRMFFQRTPSHP